MRKSIFFALLLVAYSSTCLAKTKLPSAKQDSSYCLIVTKKPLSNAGSLLIEIQVFDQEGFSLPYADCFLIDKQKKCLAVVHSDKGGHILISGLNPKINYIEVGFLGYKRVRLATKEFRGYQANLKVVLTPQLLTTE